MAKTDKWERQHRADMTRIEQQVLAIYEAAAREAAAIGMTVGDLSDDLFTFDRYPITKERIERLMNDMHNRIETVVVNGINSQWTLANNKNNELCRRVFGSALNSLTLQQQRRYSNNNEAAREAFLARKEAGLGLSDRVWRYSDLYRHEIELGLDVGLRAGTSADELTRELRSYLKYPDKLFRRVRDERGLLVLSQAAKNFHPGRGVYRSSYMNARRLAATETNMAYRAADYERWQQLDFVVGIEVHLSNNHTCRGYKGKTPWVDICDELQGKYPKGFKFTGWHPHCRCHAIPILKTAEELEADNQRIMDCKEPLNDSENSISKENSDGVKNLEQWVKNNKERAKGWANMPYFVKDNAKYIDDFRVGIYSEAEKIFTRHYHTKPSMNIALDEKMQALFPHLEPTERAAIYNYTRGDVSDFRKLNKQLRNDNLSKFNSAFSTLLSFALEKLPSFEGTVYRTIRLNKTDLEKWISIAESKGTMEFQCFTSASKSIDFVENSIEKKSKSIKKNETDILLLITSKNGKNIEELSMFKNQKEVLFNKETHFKFLEHRYSESKHVFLLEEM